MFEVRFASINELDRINELRGMVNDLHVSGRPDIFRPGFCRELRDHIFERYNDDKSAIIVAVADGIVCGFATIIYIIKPETPYSLERKIYQVEEFGVDPQFRRRGAATAIVDFLRKDAAEKCFDRIELDMWSFNESAYEFYKAVGFHTYRRYMELNVCGYPTRENAERLLREAELLNPGSWGDHSRVAAKCAELIASHCPNLDPEKAFTLGLMHDIGRRFGFSYFEHIYDGYMYMNDLGYPEAAKICLTHSFSYKDVNEYIGEFDVTEEQLECVRAALEECEYDDYDRLIQLCDAVAMPGGAVSMLDRMNDVKRRYGSYPQKKWEKNLELLHYFEELSACRIEELIKDIAP